METLKIQYEIDFEEMIIKFFVRFTGFEKGYGVKLKYKGLYDNNALEKSLGNFVKNVHSTLEKHLTNVRGDSSIIETLSDVELSLISETVIKHHS